jgi:hypothetical protein
MTRCAIHQPTFLPWLGYFDKVRKADTFVFLDAVDYQKSGKSMGSWCNRVKMRVKGTAAWVSCPVIREHGPQPINMVRIDNSRPWRDDIRRLLESSYREARNFDHTFALIDSLLAFETDRISEFNINAITVISEYLGLRPRFLRQSTMTIHEKATARLVAIVQAVGADTYISGDGASDYLEVSAFDKAGLRVVYQSFTPKPYGDPDRFIPGLSIVDWLMHGDDPADTNKIFW